MTKIELIHMLSDASKNIPDDAQILAFDGDAGEARPVTGFIYGGDDDHTVELITDED